MISIDKFRKLALSLPNVSEAPHFERTSFRVGKKIFTTLHEEKKIATLKFSVVDQSVYCSVNKIAIYPVPNKWGLQGWTFIELNKVSANLMSEALQTAYHEVSDKERK